MRFLVVDDDAQKADVLRDCLVENGILPENVIVADCVVAARRALAAASFDAMLLDVLLPVRSPGTPAGANSIELLKEIIDDGSTAAPRYVIGVTAEMSAVEAHAAEFQRFTLNVIHVAPGEDVWKEFIHNFVAFIRRADEARATFDVDVCVLNALKTPELDAVLATWPVTLGAEKLLNSSVLYRDGICRFSSGERRVVCAYQGQMGPAASVHAATSVLTAFRPRVLLMTGICGGFSDRAQIGDIVVAERSWDWQAGKWAENGVLLAAPDHREASPELTAHARTIEHEKLIGFCQSFRGCQPERAPQLILGPMVTGSSVVASTDIQEVFREQHRKMAAVDMECYGIYYATSVSSGPQTKVLCVKAVSDLADRAKADNFQKYCSHISAFVGFEIADRYFGAESSA
ncbi:MAG: hypothetical protein QM761_06650 [Pseudoxanthomonas sp.]